MEEKRGHIKNERWSKLEEMGRHREHSQDNEKQRLNLQTAPQGNGNFENQINHNHKIHSAI